MNETTLYSALSGLPLKPAEAVPMAGIRNELLALLATERADLPLGGVISQIEYDLLRSRYLAQVLSQQQEELEKLETEVLSNLRKEALEADKADDPADDAASTFGQRVADKVAAFGGSWTFIGWFTGIIFIWIGLNAVFLTGSQAFDPYPFILLNLLLSCIAALQAPVIMMSQNRMEAKDRARAENDYKINLKAEIEVQQLHTKLDHLMHQQMRYLTEAHALQLSLLQEFIAHTSAGKVPDNDK